MNKPKIKDETWWTIPINQLPTLSMSPKTRIELHKLAADAVYGGPSMLSIINNRHKPLVNPEEINKIQDNITSTYLPLK